MKTSIYSLSLAFTVLTLISATRVPAQTTRGPGNAIRFEGVSHHVTLQGPAFPVGSGLTLETWVRPLLSPPGGTLLWSGGSLRLAFCQGPDVLCFGVALTSGYHEFSVSTLPVGFGDGLWHHLAATYDGSNLSVYGDGNLLGSTNIPGVLVVGGPSEMGLVVTGENNYLLGFAGDLDDVRVWSVARTQFEISQNMNRPLMGTEPGLEGYYRLDEGTGGIAHDSSGHGRDGQLINFYVGPWDGAGWIASTAPLGQPLTFTQAPVEVATNQATLRGVVKPFGAETTSWFEWGIVGLPANTPTPTNNVGSGTVSVPVSFTLTNLLPARYYAYHCTATNVSGSSTGSNYFFLTLGAPIVNTLAPSDFSPASVRLNGVVIPNGFEAAAWFEYGLTTNYGSRTPLTPLGAGTSEVAASNLISDFIPAITVHYRVVATNSLGTTYGPDVSFTTLGPAGTALQFNGLTTLVALPVITPTFTSKLTLEAWVVPYAVQRPVMCQWKPGFSPVWTLLFGTSQTLSFGLSTSAGYQLMDASLSLPGYGGGAWHHLAVTYDGSFMRLYHNARLLASKAMVGSIGTFASANAIGFGPEGPFNGQIDEVRIWSGARTQAEIDQGRFRRLTGTETGLLVYWRLDEGTGTTAADASGNGRTGTLLGGPQWLPSGVPLGVPFVQANVAALTEPDAAMLSGLINPDGFATTGWFEWGTDTNYNQSPVRLDLGDGTSTLSITQALTGLTPGTTYHFRVAAVNTNGTMKSAEKSFVLGPANKALWFGGAGDYVHLPPLNFGGGHQLTLEAWIKPEAITNASWSDIIRQETAYYAPSYARDWLLALYDNSVSFGLNTGLSYPNQFPVLTASLSAGRLDDGRWHHVAATYDGSMKRLYLDGVEVANASQTGNIVNSGNACAIGAMAWGAGEFFRGAMEEVRVWTTARSQVQIIQKMNQPLAGNEAGLLAYFPFSEGTGDVTADPTGHGYGGQLMGSPARVVSDALNRAFCVTLPVTNFSNVTAELNAAANPAGLPMQVWFEWGATTNYGRTTIPQFAGAGTSVLVVTQALSDLAAGTDYHCRAVASNANERIVSADVQFLTRGPQVQTLPPTALTATSMALNGTVNARGLSTQYWFDWGTNSSYGFSTPPRVGYGDTRSYAETVTNLTPGQTYHYRIMATNSGGLANGQDQNFSPSFSNAFTPVGSMYESAVAWGDYDRDGDLDLVVTGTRGTNGTSGLFRNADAAFNLIWGTWYMPPGGGSSFPHVWSGSASWGDLNNDGALELLLTGDHDYGYGQNNPQIAQVWRTSAGQFTNVTELTGVGRSAATVGDYDNDGYLDILLTGRQGPYYDSVSLTNILYHNNGDGTFTDVHAGLPPVFDGAVAWGDYDNDGQLDLLIAGNTGSGLLARVYHNNNGGFTDISAGLLGVAPGSAAWGDYDGDGWLDILLAGSNNLPNAAACKVYRNNHDGTFTDRGVNLPGVYRGTAAWGDYDNDGQLDILLTGAAPARIYRNEHGVFTDIAAGLPTVASGEAAWGDYDGDGRLDLAIMESSYYGWWESSFSVFQNLLPITNIPPNPPTVPGGLLSSVLNTKVTLRWDAASDAHTPSAGLTYNVRVGTSPGGGQIVPPHSDPVTGQRRLPQRGNAEHRLFSVVTNLPVGLYYWSVQAVNNSFVGSPWAPEQTFAVTSGPPVVTTRPASNVLCCSALLNGAVAPGGLAARAWFEWGTNSNFGNATPPLELGTGLQPLLVQQTLPDLQPRITYFFRLAATNSAGSALGTNQQFTTEGPAPVVATLTSSNVSYTGAALFGTSPLSSPAADYFLEWGTTTAYGQFAPAVIGDAALGFDGVDDCFAVGWGRFPSVTNNFTMELWVNPTAARAVTVESVGGIAGWGGQRYAVFPEQGNAAYGAGNHAGAGLSVGTNGVSVMEAADAYIPTVLVYSNGLSGWTHIALVYSNHVPLLFVNATLARTGLISTKAVHPSAGLGGVAEHPWNSFGPFVGEIQDARIWDVPLDAPTIQAWMNQMVTANHPAYSHLLGYWPLSEGRGTNAADVSTRKNTGQLLKGTGWTGGHQSTARLFREVLDGLSPGTTYHFRAVAINPGGTAYGADQTFMTLPLPRVLGVTVRTTPTTPGALLRFSGSPGFGYVMEASTNLVNWLALTNLVAGTDGLFEFLDTSATNFPTRFYRLRVP